MIKEEEIKQLAALARIEIPVDEISKLQKDLESILDYVSELDQVADDTILDLNISNVMREDDQFHSAGQYTEDILKQAPETKDDFVKVKKILG